MGEIEKTGAVEGETSVDKSSVSEDHEKSFKEESEAEKHKQLLNGLKKSIASGYVNFLFGAGVNGNAFPNMD